jgi:MOSC domain-containing protein YiiM
MTEPITDDMVIDRISIASDHGAELTVLEYVEAVADSGLQGDRHFGNAARHVTIQSRQELGLASERLGRPIDPDLTRRNITVTAGLLPRTRGQRIVVGEAVLEVFADAAPCALMEELNGEGARTALKKLAGIHCKVITSGRIRTGDALLLTT